jgi:transcription elongation factor Elf1
MATLAELEEAVSKKKSELLSSPYPHGPCECTAGCMVCKHRPGPAAFVVQRDGKPVKVCTKCDLTGEQSALLVTPTDDLDVYDAWDDLGAWCIRRKLQAMSALSESDPR